MGGASLPSLFAHCPVLVSAFPSSSASASIDRKAEKEIESWLFSGEEDSMGPHGSLFLKCLLKSLAITKKLAVS